MEIALIACALCLIGGSVLGYWLATHIHSVAASAASAVTRATTVPSSDVAALNTKIDGLGDKLQSIVASIGKPLADAAAKVG